MTLFFRYSYRFLTCIGLTASLLLHPAATLAATGSLTEKLAALEKSTNGRIGMALIETGTQRKITWRGDERFAMASTFKTLLVGAVLQQSVKQPNLLNKRITYSQQTLLSYSPITKQHVNGGMTVAELCAAAIEWSDNTAANLLLKETGGPGAVTAMARTLDDTKTRLDRWEPELNTAIPGDERDTSTPLFMANNLQKLAVGTALPEAQQRQLVNWMKNNTTGTESIRAGVPKGWVVGDKTGSGDYGTTNDLAIIWPPQGEPLILAVYFTQRDRNAEARRDVLASVAKLVLAER